MRSALIINLANAHNFVIDFKPIKDLYYEKPMNSGIILFYDNEYEVIMFGCSVDNVEDLGKDIEPEGAFYYNIIKDTNQQLTEDEINNIYDGIIDNRFSIHIVNDQEPIKATICLN